MQPGTIRELRAAAPRDIVCLCVLRAAAQAQHEAVIGPWAAAVLLAMQRVCKACAGLHAVRGAACARVSDEAGQALPAVVGQSLAGALSYDFRLCP